MIHRLVVAAGVTGPTNKGNNEVLVKHRTTLLAVTCEDDWTEPLAEELADWVSDVLLHVKHGKPMPKGVVSANTAKAERVAELLSGVMVGHG